MVRRALNGSAWVLGAPGHLNGPQRVRAPSHVGNAAPHSTAIPCGIGLRVPMDRDPLWGGPLGQEAKDHTCSTARHILPGFQPAAKKGGFPVGHSTGRLPAIGLPSSRPWSRQPEVLESLRLVTPVVYLAMADRTWTRWWSALRVRVQLRDATALVQAGSCSIKAWYLVLVAATVTKASLARVVHGLPRVAYVGARGFRARLLPPA